MATFAGTAAPLIVLPAGSTATFAADNPRTFGATLQSALLSELEVRLQPALGLIEAYNDEMKIRHD